MASAKPVARPLCLVVEDEPLLRLHAVDVAEEAGFDVIDVGDADQAIAILQVRPDIRVVFTDIEMPGSMDGLKLARFIRDRWPPIEIVITSGRFALGTGDMPDRSQFFSKPYDVGGLSDALKLLVA